MKPELIVEFTKMHGAGNDFIVIDNRFYHFSEEDLSLLARRWCSRTEGIGADGILAFEAPVKDAHDYRMRYVNADGSKATMCANGARCLALFAPRSGLETRVLTFESDAGLYRAEVTGDERVRLFVPPPRDYSGEIALKEVKPPLSLSYVWTGTEHVVGFVDDIETVNVAKEGRAIRNDAALAPAGANVNFVESREGALHVRTYEKGVEAETRSCGTGAIASAVVARLKHIIDEPEVEVYMPGGALTVGAALDKDALRDVYLEGPAATVFRGTFEY